ncbi:MAG: hypothetical protein K0Q49_1879 [Haloplasmataceae bacterium]|jgi:hypothetical protein|nr:hypothetical protein [Haloplasmataceae bacterium]
MNRISNKIKLNKYLNVNFTGGNLTSDAGPLLYKE